MPIDHRSGFGRTAQALALSALVAFGIAGAPAAQAQTATEPVLIGVSGPLTGPQAQYGAQWKKGFDLALDEVNSKKAGAKDGAKGRPLQVVFEDSQNDPRQAVAIAQKFVSDPRIVIELGDFASPTSMAASPIYQRGELVQLGFTNSHPDFTKGGDYIWSNSTSQAEEAPLLADYAVNGLGLKRLAVLHLNTDWGRTSKDLFVKAAQDRGAQVVVTEGYLADEKDFRSTLVRVREANPDGVILISYYADGAAIARQLRPVGLTQPVVAVGSVYSPKFLELGGEAVNGVHTTTRFFSAEPRPEVQAYVARYRAKYGEDPDVFSTYAYDSIILVNELVSRYGAERKAIHDGLAKIDGVPSVIFGPVKFDVEARRIYGIRSVKLVVKDGAFTQWDGSKPVASAN
jgi:branched-chain amino acid transport system substrate-binding protein